MNAIDEYDIREAFDVLDEECQGSLTFEQLQTLYLGLGYTSPERMTVEHLQHDAQEALGYFEPSLSLEETLKLMSKYRRDRSDNIKAMFSVLDCDQDNHITIEDLVEASARMNEPVSEEMAKQMILHAQGGGENSNSGNGAKLSRKEYQQFFEPPDP